MNEVLDLIKHYPVDKQKKIVNESLNELNKKQDELDKLSSLQEIEDLGKLINEKIKIDMVLCTNIGIEVFRKIKKISKEIDIYNNKECYEIKYVQYYESGDDAYIQNTSDTFSNKNEFNSWLKRHITKEDSYIMERVKEFI